MVRNTEKFIKFVIRNDIISIKEMMREQPIDFRDVLKGLELSIKFKNHTTFQLLYNKYGKIDGLGNKCIKKLLLIAFDYRNEYIINMIKTEIFGKNF